MRVQVSDFRALDPFAEFGPAYSDDPPVRAIVPLTVAYRRDGYRFTGGVILDFGTASQRALVEWVDEWQWPHAQWCGFEFLVVEAEDEAVCGIVEWGTGN